MANEDFHIAKTGMVVFEPDWPVGTFVELKEEEGKDPYEEVRMRLTAVLKDRLNGGPQVNRPEVTVSSMRKIADQVEFIQGDWKGEPFVAFDGDNKIIAEVYPYEVAAPQDTLDAVEKAVKE